MLTNKAEAAVAAGLIEFDCTLPQRWLDNTAELLAAHLGCLVDAAYSLLQTQTVWCYDSEPLFGEPHYLSEDLANDMKTVEAVYGDQPIER